jgi:hypothetical protein
MCATAQKRRVTAQGSDVMAQRYEKKFVIYDRVKGENVFESTKGFYPPRFDEERGYLFWNRKTFAKQFSDVDFPKDMTMLDRGRLATLAKRIWGNSNVLVSKKNGQKQPIDVAEIADTIGLSMRYTEEWLQRMNMMDVIVFNDVIRRGNKERFYYVNPLYFFSSNRMPLALYLMFRDVIDAQLPYEVKTKFAQQHTEKEKNGMTTADICVEAFEKGLRGKREDGVDIDEVASAIG